MFPCVDDLIRYIQEKANSILSGLQSSTNSLVDFINLLQQKVQALSSTILEIKQIIDRIVGLLSLQGGIYTLYIPPNIGGNQYIKTSLQSATGAPTNSDYAGGFVFLASEAVTWTALEFIFGKLNPPGVVGPTPPY